MMKINILAPCSGKIIPLSLVPDEAFASGMLGEGVAVEPEDGAIYSPVSGKILSVSESRHAYAIAASFGDVLVHIGIDTINAPEAFLPLVKVGDEVSAGQPIAGADLDIIKKAGLSSVIPLIITDLREPLKLEPNHGKVTGGKDTAAWLVR